MTTAKRRHLTIAAGPDPADVWLERLARTATKEIKPVAANALAVARKAPGITGSIRYNKLTARVEVVQRLPGDIDTGLGALSDTHIHALTAYVGERYGMHVKPGMMADAVLLASQEFAFDPVRDYFDALHWDGTPRVAAYATSYLGCVASSYVNRVSMILFVGIAARAYLPGCKVDTVVILEGRQGCGKTTAVRELCNPDWFIEITETVGSPELARQIRSAVVGEFGELSSMARAEFNRTKQFVTIQADMVRDPYARFAVSHPRRCVFLGTTNSPDWNKDPTGARRFLPMRVSAFDMQAYLRDRDQLWAEAVHLYKAGTDYWTLPESASDEQDARYDHDVWTEPLTRWLAGKSDSKHYPPELDTRPIDQGGGVSSATAAELMLHALGVETSKQNNADWMRVARVMCKLGWTKERVFRNGVRAARYLRPSEDDDAAPF